MILFMSFRCTFISLIFMFFWFWINSFAKSNDIVTVRKHRVPEKLLAISFLTHLFLLVLLCYLYPYLRAQCVHLQPTALNSSKLVKSSDIRPMSNLLPLIYNLYVYAYRSVFAVVNNHIIGLDKVSVILPSPSG